MSEEGEREGGREGGLAPLIEADDQVWLGLGAVECVHVHAEGVQLPQGRHAARNTTTSPAPSTVSTVRARRLGVNASKS